MSGTAPQPEFSVSDAELHRFVAQSLEKDGDGSRRLATVERSPSDYRSSFAIEDVTAVFEDGQRLPLVFKNLSPDGLLNDAREARTLLDNDPAREAFVYQCLLAHAQLGTATCYGASADESSQRYWLLLEKVEGGDLARTGDFTVWTAAAHWLADAHHKLTSVASTRPGDGALGRFDQACFHQWADHAERALRERHGTRGRELPHWKTQWVLDRARAAADLAGAIPPEVIHGEFYPSNILIGASANAARICVVDWETAGMGPPLLDVAALIAGSWPTRQKDELANAYFTAKAKIEQPQEQRSLWTELRCCRLLLAVKWIGVTTGWQPPPPHRYDWLAEALELVQLLDRELKNK